jgi:hypothetical protein
MDTTSHPALINTRFAYVSVSRPASDARIYTNDATTLAERLASDITKTIAVRFHEPTNETHSTPHSMENAFEHAGRFSSAVDGVSHAPALPKGSGGSDQGFSL